MSAILLPFASSGDIDWQGFDNHVAKTFDCGLIPAINMDTGYAHLIDDDVREATLSRCQSIAAGKPFLGGVFVGDLPDDPFDADGYARGVDEVQSFGGTPILFQSFGLTSGDDEAIETAYKTVSSGCDTFYAFELGTVFAPFGKIYSLDLYERLMGISNCLGAKHSSLDRVAEWNRLELRDRIRPDFRVMTGNDLAVDMVIYGSDYLLGLSTFCPEAFARRDEMWEQGDPRFYQLNDLIQYLGTFAFRAPVPAYKHSAAMYLHLRGKIASSLTHPNSPSRPESDLEILSLIARDIDTYLEQSS